MDVDKIPPGSNFRKVLAEQLAVCDVMLVIIGPGWIDARDKVGKRRLDDPDDPLRLEVETALDRGVPVIPVLVDGAEMPLQTDLPKSLNSLTEYQAVRLTHERFGSEVGDLVELLRKLVPPERKWWRGGKSTSDATARPMPHPASPADAQGPNESSELAGKVEATPNSHIRLTLLGLSILGLAIGVALGIGSLRGLDLIVAPPPSPSFALSVWQYAALLSVTLGWLILSAWTAKGAARWRLSRIACAASCAAAWSLLWFLTALTAAQGSNFVPGSSAAIITTLALGLAAVSGYALSVWLLLWKPMLATRRKSARAAR